MTHVPSRNGSERRRGGNPSHNAMEATHASSTER
jgi:hypothetical protein